MSTYSNAHAKVKNEIFHVSFPGNWFELGSIGNDFSSSTIWAIQINVLFAEFKNRKNPGIQPSNIQHYFLLNILIVCTFNLYWQITETKSENREITHRVSRKQNPEKF